MTDQIDKLAEALEAHGPIPCVRVSSAQARGAAKAYAYWGAVRYEVRRRKRDGAPSLVARARAGSDRRSYNLAIDDARRLAEELGAVYVGAMTPGRLRDDDAEDILRDAVRLGIVD